MASALDLTHIIMLAIAGVLGGGIASVVGGAGIVTFPALLATGMSPVVATATNLLALTPAFFVAIAGDHRQAPPFDRSFFGLAATSIFGAGFGAILLLTTPEKIFGALIPLLMAVATMLFALSGRISAWFAKRSTWQGDGPRPFRPNYYALFPVCIYGGYFGGGAAIMLLAVLTIGTGGDYRSANVLKNVMAGLNSLTASTLFAIKGNVDWHAMVIMMLGGLLGGYVGARLIRLVPRDVMRIVIVGIGAWLTGYYAWIYWV